MRAVNTTVLGAITLVAGILAGALGQTAARSNTTRRELLKPLATDVPYDSTSIIREIDDPNSGTRWLLLDNALHPGEPGRMVRSETVAKSILQPGASGQKGQPIPQPVIHTGERLILEEHSPVIDARLDAVALNPCVVGGALRVRLIIGGRVVRAIALGAGRVILDQEQEGRP